MIIFVVVFLPDLLRNILSVTVVHIQHLLGAIL